MITFNKAPVVGAELDYIQQAINSNKLCGDGHFSKQSEVLLEKLTGCKKALLTPSCTAALEMAAILIDVKPGDEVIMPSYTFVSTANAFALRGAKIVFVDVDPTTMNIDPVNIAKAITPNTKAIVPVHYAGIACKMDEIMQLADEHKLYVIEDAAQAIDSTYKGKALGSIGHLGTFSFHETKNVTSGGEGGALLINDPDMVERAEIIREKGTNRSLFFRGSVDKYSWVDIGSSYLPSEIQAAYLYAQLQAVKEINDSRRSTWQYYYDSLSELAKSGVISLPFVPDYASNNAHMFYLKCENLEQRTAFLAYMRENGISAVFHYVPLHSSVAGLEFGTFVGEDEYTTTESERLVRLPLYFKMSRASASKVVDRLIAFYQSI